MISFRCAIFRHDTRIVTEGDEGRIVCRRCQTVLDRWPLLRPEQVIAAQQAHAAVMRDRAERVKRLSEPERPRIVRMTR